MTAQGIHDHPRLKLGLIPHSKSKDELLQIRWAVEPGSVAPTEVDHMTITPGLDKNDVWGICGPTSADNINRIITKYETGTQVNAMQTQVNTLYTESSKPPFDPATGANDNGVQNPDLYAAWLKDGLAGEAPIAYGQLADTSDASIALAIDVFGAVTMAVDLQTAQQSQSSAATPVWDYSKSADWGGHDICIGAISSKTGLADCYSWAEKIAMTEAFRKHQMLELWVPLFESVMLSDKFDLLVDSTAMKSDLSNLTGGKFTWPSAPAPTPTPQPITPPTASLQINLTDADVIARITKVAKGNVDLWTTKHFASYFKVKD